MRFKTMAATVVTVAMLASTGIGFAQEPSGTGSGEHGVGAGPDPKTTGAQGAPDMNQGTTMNPGQMNSGQMMTKKPMHKSMKHKTMHKKHMHKTM